VLRDRVARAGDGAGGNERILGWSWVGADGWAVATDRAFRAVTGAAEVGGSDLAPLVIPWSRVAKARWADGTLELIGTPLGAAAVSRFAFDVGEEGRLAEAVQVAVTDSLLWEQRVEDADGRGALVVARRGDDGSADWTVVFDRGIDPSDSAVRAWADAQLEQVRTQTGL
jgi:hypothetical protein